MGLKVSKSIMTPESFEKLAEHLQQRHNNNQRRVYAIPGFRKAAVLVGVQMHYGQADLMLTVRSQHLANHGGQISFPGGKLETGETVQAAAMREAKEEIGLNNNQVQLVGLLNDVWTPAKFSTTPVLAIIENGASFLPDPNEVGELLRVPIAELKNMQPRVETRIPKIVLPPELGPEFTGPRQVLHYDWRGHDIWGMTAWVISELLEWLEKI